MGEARDLVGEAVRNRKFGDVTAGKNVFKQCSTFSCQMSGKRVSKDWYDEICGNDVKFDAKLKPVRLVSASSFNQIAWKDTERVGFALGSDIEKGDKSNEGKKRFCMYAAAGMNHLETLMGSKRRMFLEEKTCRI